MNDKQKSDLVKAAQVAGADSTVQEFWAEVTQHLNEIDSEGRKLIQPRKLTEAPGGRTV